MNAALTLTRRSLVLAALSAAGPALAAKTPCRKPRVLFVCPAGTVKSPIAREYLRQRAAARGLAVEVQSRGVIAEDHVTPSLMERLRGEGVDPRSEPVSRVGASDIARADIVVVFDEAAQAPGLEHARAWSVPSWLWTYDEARAALLPKIDALIAELSARGCSA